MLKVAILLSSVMLSSQSQAATTEWMLSGKMGVLLTRLDMQGLRPVKVSCKKVGGVISLQLVTVPNPERFKWTVRWNVKQQWQPIKSWHDSRNYRMVSYMAIPDPAVREIFCAVWVGSTW